MRIHVVGVVIAVLAALPITSVASDRTAVIDVDESATGTSSGADRANADTERADAPAHPVPFDVIRIAEETTTPIGTGPVDTSVAFVPPPSTARSSEGSRERRRHR